MTIAEMSSGSATQVSDTRAMDAKLEVVVLPVTNIDRAKQFYESLGWRLDADLAAGEDVRVIHLTPPGSATSVIVGTGGSAAVPGSVDNLVLAVDDVEAARAELVARGVDVSEVFHDEGGVFHHAGTNGRVPPDLERRSNGSWASFSDPDGNEWLLQEIATRLPGRETELDVATLAGLLLETAVHHGGYEKIAPAHDWWDWYAPYLSAREQGHSPEQADAAADLYMKEARGVVVSR